MRKTITKSQAESYSPKGEGFRPGTWKIKKAKALRFITSLMPFAERLIIIMAKLLKKDGFTVIIVYTCVLAILGSIGLYNLFVKIHVSSATAIVVLRFVLYWLLLIPTVLFMRRDKESANDIGFSRIMIPKQILIGLVLGVAMSIVLTVIPTLFGLRNYLWGSIDDMRVLDFVWPFFFNIFAVGLVEETIFRGHLFKKLLDIKKSKWFAIIISSVLFGLFHIFNFNLLQIVVTTAIGIIFCLCRNVKYCSLLSLIIMHGLYDTLIPVVVKICT